MFVRSVAIALCLFAPSLARAQSSDAFLDQLRRAVEADDRAAVTGAIRYPITISIGGLRVPFTDAASVLERYDVIFTPELRESIAGGSQDITVALVDGQWRLTSITVPHVAADARATVAPSADGSREAGRSSGSTASRSPRRVSIRVGPRPTQIPGLLAQGATDVLIVYLPKGKLASVRLERVPAGAAVIRVIHATTGAPLAAKAAAEGRLVSGRPPDSADYRIEVRRIPRPDSGGADDAHLPYMLSLSLR
jgi:hypothetical protein